MQVPITSVPYATRSNLVTHTPGRQSAVFLDRDGVLMKFGKPEEVDDLIYPQALQALARLARDFPGPVVLVTNQRLMDPLHHPIQAPKAWACMERFVEGVVKAGGRLDHIYYNASQPNEPPPPEGLESGHKPEAGMFLRAAADFGATIDLADSYMVGDSASDINAADKADPSMVSILVTRTGNGGTDGVCQPDQKVDDVAAAIEMILSIEGGERRPPMEPARSGPV